MRRTHLGIASLAAAALLLAGCGASEPEPAQTSDRADVKREKEPKDAAPKPTDEPTEEPTESAPPVAGDLTAPGTTLAIGEPATLHVQALEEGDEYYGYFVVQTTVTEIVEGDPAIFADFENAADFEGYVPYYIHAEHVVLSAVGTPNSNMIPTVFGLYADGSTSGGVVSFGGGLSTVCPTEYYDEKVVGATASTCTVALGEAGTPVTGAGWRGDDYADGNSSENPYYDNPVTWSE